MKLYFLILYGTCTEHREFNFNLGKYCPGCLDIVLVSIRLIKQKNNSLKCTAKLISIDTPHGYTLHSWQLFSLYWQFPNYCDAASGV